MFIITEQYINFYIQYYYTLCNYKTILVIVYSHCLEIVIMEVKNKNHIYY